MLAVAALSALLAGSAAAAESFDHHPMRFERISIDDGLSQSNVLAILQDSRGMMWFGTENGLNRYNGYEFETYRRERGNAHALPNDFIFDVAEDHDGNLWIATNGGGLAMLDRGKGQFISYRNNPDDAGSIGSNVVRRVLVDADGSVWAGTRGGGLSRLDRKENRFLHYRFGNAEAGKPDNVFALLRDSKGSLWVGGDHGLARLNTETGVTVTYGNGESSPGEHSVRAIVEDRAGRLWFGTYGGGLYRFETGSDSFTRFTHDPNDDSSIAGDEVTSIFEDSANRLWVGTTSGLNLVDRRNDRFVRYRTDDGDATSLSDDSVTVIYEDRAGVMWFGTKTRGLNKWNSRTWEYGLEPARELTADAAQEPNVTSFVEDADGRLWIGTFGDGLNRVDRETGDVTRYRHDPADPGSISDDRVMSLMRDREGRIWIGTMTAGIDRLDPDTGEIRRYVNEADDPTSLGANGIMTMYEDSKGLVWVGTFGGGISRFDPATETFTRLQADPANPDSLSSNRVTSIVEDTNGRIWVGTDAGGLNLHDPQTGKFHHFRNDPHDPATLADDTVYSLNVDAGGTVWVGTRGGGLDRVVGDVDEPGAIRFANVSQADGLANDVIYGVQFDDSGRVWVSTNYGISRYDPQSGQVRNLHRNDGLQSEEFNFGAHYRSGRGELFFGGHNGYNAFDPDELSTSGTAPLVALTGFFLNDPVVSDIPVEASDGVEISYKDDVIAFEFAAMDFASPWQNQYMYKLEGFDKDWINLGNRRRITYTNLDAGSYLLRVRAANSEGVWNDAGLMIPVRVTPAPWETWWAYLGYVALLVQLGVFLWLGHKRKIRREEEYSRRLELEVQERTEKLIDRNNQLKLLNQALQESSLSDPLTGLRNRRFVFEEISKDLELVRRKLSEEHQGIDQSDKVDLVFMMIDLDHFKPINDTYGHSAGDQLLLEVRDVLLGTCRRSDFVIRWGGDEFVVIAKQAKPGESEALAERIRTKISQHNFVLGDGQIVRTTCSIGFAAYPLFRAQLDESSLDQIISLADGLMYEAKKVRNAWAGMFSPTEASTSYPIEDGALEPTSLLFRAKRGGTLSVHDSALHGDGPSASTNSARQSRS